MNQLVPNQTAVIGINGSSLRAEIAGDDINPSTTWQLQQQQQQQM